MLAQILEVAAGRRARSIVLRQPVALALQVDAGRLSHAAASGRCGHGPKRQHPDWRGLQPRTGLSMAVAPTG